jgi:hypothetical protein
LSSIIFSKKKLNCCIAVLFNGAEFVLALRQKKKKRFQKGPTIFVFFEIFPCGVCAP